MPHWWPEAPSTSPANPPCTARSGVGAIEAMAEDRSEVGGLLVEALEPLDDSEVSAPPVARLADAGVEHYEGLDRGGFLVRGAQLEQGRTRASTRGAGSGALAAGPNRATKDFSTSPGQKFEHDDRGTSSPLATASAAPRPEVRRGKRPARRNTRLRRRSAGRGSSRWWP